MAKEKSIFDEWNELLKDPEFMQNMEKYLMDKEESRERNKQRISKFFHDDDSFESVLLRIMQKHDERWTDACYAKNVEPYPWEILYAICNIAQDEGTPAEPLDPLTESWPSRLFEYKGFTFAWTDGQGTVLSIYDKDKALVFRT